MIRRGAWFVSGAIAGVTGVSVLRRKVLSLADQITPRNLGRASLGVARRTFRQLHRSVRAAVDAYQATGVAHPDDLRPHASVGAKIVSHRHNSPRRRSTHR